MRFETHDIDEFARLENLFDWMETDKEYAGTINVNATIENRHDNQFVIMVEGRLDTLLAVVKSITGKNESAFPFVQISDITNSAPHQS